MRGRNFEFKELLVSEAVSLSFHGFDFVVRDFEVLANNNEESLIVYFFQPSVRCANSGTIKIFFDLELSDLSADAVGFGFGRFSKMSAALSSISRFYVETMVGWTPKRLAICAVVSM